MRKLLAILLLAFSSLLYADGVLHFPNGMIVFKTGTPCTNEKVVALIKDELVPLFKEARALVVPTGKVYAGCWAANPDSLDDIHVVFETGEVSVFPRRAIQFDPEV